MVWPKIINKKDKQDAGHWVYIQHSGWSPSPMCLLFPFTIEHSSVYRFLLEWPLHAQREAKDRKVRRKTTIKTLNLTHQDERVRQGTSRRFARSQCDRINFQRAGHDVDAKVCPLASNNWETALRNTKHPTNKTPAQGTTKNDIWGHRSGAVCKLPLTSSPKVHLPLLQSLTSKICYVQNKLRKSSNSAIYHLCSLGKLSNAD